MIRTLRSRALLGALTMLAAAAAAQAQGTTYEVPFTIPTPGGGNPFAALSPLKQMHVKVGINGQEPRAFLFDTGASFPIVLGEEFAKELGVKTVMDVEVTGVGTAQSKLALLDAVQFGDYRETEVPCATLDLSNIQAQTAMLGISFDGIIGISFFTAFKSMEMDYRKNVIRFTTYGPGETPDEEVNKHRAKLKKALRNLTDGKGGAFLGVAGEPLEPTDADAAGVKAGLKLTQIVPDSAAARAGLKEGDVLYELDGDPLGSPSGLQLDMAARSPGEQVPLAILRDGKKETVTVTLGKRPAAPQTAPHDHGAGEQPPAAPQRAGSTSDGPPAVWTCPMHPQVRAPKPGNCPQCGMPLVPARGATPAAPAPTPRPVPATPGDESDDF